MTIAFRPLRNPNPLGFPGVRPGVDWSHPAANGVRFSAISAGAGFLNVLPGTLGASVGSPAGTVDASLGNATTYAATTDAATFAGQSTAADLQFTMAAILKFNTVSGSATIMANSRASSGIFLGINLGGTSNAWGVAWRGIANTNFSLVPTVSVPYFFAASSISTGAVNIIVANLATGAVSTQSGSVVASQSAPNGTYSIGNLGTSNSPAKAAIAAVMYGSTFFTVPQLLAWAADPWSFWYPRRDTMLIGAAAAAFKAYWAQQNNMPVIGTGTY